VLAQDMGANQGTAAGNTAGWPVTAGGLAEITTAWTSANSGDSNSGHTNAQCGANCLSVNTAGYSTATLLLNQGSISGGQVVIEASDSTGFTTATYNLPGGRPSQSLNNNSIVPNYNYQYNFSGGSNTVLKFDCTGWTAIRARLNTSFTGAGTVNVGWIVSSSPGSFVNVQNASLDIASSNIHTAIGDNLQQVNIFADPFTNANPLYVGGSAYGGSYSGTAASALQYWSKSYTCTQFKTVQATASGNTAIWTPLTGNKWMLLAYQIQVTDNATLGSAGVETITFQDGTTAFGFGTDVYIPATALDTELQGYSGPWVSMGQFGYQSSTANNALNVNLGTALATGNVRVNVCGVEN